MTFPKSAAKAKFERLRSTQDLKILLRVTLVVDDCVVKRGVVLLFGMVIVNATIEHQEPQTSKRMPSCHMEPPAAGERKHFYSPSRKFSLS